MTWLPGALLSAALAVGQTQADAVTQVHNQQVVATEAPATSFLDGAASSGFLKGDTCFPRFISPVTNPVFSKDPRSFTYARGLFIQDQMDSSHPLGGGDFQATALQAGVAVNERLTIIVTRTVMSG